MTGQETLEKPMQNNDRFMAGKGVGCLHADLASMVDSQRPIAAFLCYSDSLASGKVTILDQDE